RYEAKGYDQSHNEIKVQLPEVWRQMLGQALRIHGDRRLRVLDFGCGTGFEAQQLLDGVPAERIERLVCYDLSAEMLERCRKRLTGSNVDVVLTDSLKDLQSFSEPFDILMTNSLLHHLPDPLGTIAAYLPQLAADAIWL